MALFAVLSSYITEKVLLKPILKIVKNKSEWRLIFGAFRRKV